MDDKQRRRLLPSSIVHRLSSSAQSRPNLVLAGFMGTGKSTVGRLLATQMGRSFFDTDEEIEAAVGLRVSEIFARQGEAAFRQYEREACYRLANNEGQVIALGGGALLDPTSRAALEKSGVIVLLTCEPHILARRLEASARQGDRPLLDAALEERVARLLEERAACYSSIPRRVDTGHISPEQTAQQVQTLFDAAAASYMPGAAEW